METMIFNSLFHNDEFNNFQKYCLFILFQFYYYYYSLNFEKKYKKTTGRNFNMQIAA